MLGSLILYLNPTFWLLLYNRLTKSPAPSSRALSSRLRISGFWAEADISESLGLLGVSGSGPGVLG